MKTAKLMFIFVASLVLLVACGGGGETLTRDTGSTDDSDDGTTQTMSISMSIVDDQNVEQSILADTQPLNVNVRVTDEDGNAVSGEVVTYVLSSTLLANFNNDTGTSLTNSDGVATIRMTKGTSTGSGTVTASVIDSASVTKGFQSSGVIETLSINMSIVDDQDVEQTTLTAIRPLNVNVRVLDQDGNSVAGEIVSYTLSDSQLANFGNDTGTSLTNTDGIATIKMTVGSLSGSGTVSAGLENSTTITKGFQSTGAQQASPSTLELYANATQLASSGNDQIELIALVKNEQNILLSDVAVNFSVDQNASLSSIDAVTGEDGTARAMLDTRNNNENREITVTATSYSLIETLKVKVVGTEVNLNGAESIIINDTSPITVVLSDSDGNGIANKEVAIESDIGTITLLDLNEESLVTGDNGQVTVNFSSNVSGTATITATALNISEELEVVVQQDDFSFVTVSSDSLPLNEPQEITLRWFKNNLPFANGDVTITSSRGEITISGAAGNSTTTDANGIATVEITSAYAGPASISAVGSDDADNEVTARASVEFVASTVDNIFVDATPDLIGPEGQTSTITAVLRDGQGNLVKGKFVNFSLISDASGGSIAPNTAKTDSNGIASSVYTSNAVSGDSGVTIAAESQGVLGTTELTVGDRAFDISLGTGNELEIYDSATYVKAFAVFVTDASGRPVANAELTATLTPTAVDSYRKGTWYWSEDDNVYYALFSADDNNPNEILLCNSEDANKDGRLDSGEDSNRNGLFDEGEDENNDGIFDNGEDFNSDGLLTPGNVASINFKDNVSRTDEFGQATIEIRYPRQFGNWTKVNVRVFGQSAGSESMQSQEFRLGVASSDLTNQASPPPSSPFGLSGTCSDTL